MCKERKYNKIKFYFKNMETNEVIKGEYDLRNISVSWGKLDHMSSLVGELTWLCNGMGYATLFDDNSDIPNTNGKFYYEVTYYKQDKECSIRKGYVDSFKDEYKRIKSVSTLYDCLRDIIEAKQL